MDTIGKRLRQLRGRVSGEQFAALFGLNAQTIYRYERGVRKPGTYFLQMVANKTGASLEWLISGEGTPGYVPPVPTSEETQDTQDLSTQCTKLEAKIEKMEERLERIEEERREVSAENRQLHRENAILLRENGALREQLAVLEKVREQWEANQDEKGKLSALFDEQRTTPSSSSAQRVHK
ncbi:MAG: helix-turn-helix transcriptional regulator [Desulfovibrionaceae bacterium]|nr:helix-turn-helix transcriptional regulator [Desulfovibrionaceae bacterium]